ncbi:MULTISPECIES: MgtC/SapB family protein [Achromobacter]|uniref:Protein MgtC n=2 Tax=Achromobacter piechaudii TaxID=72556 RepID=A0A6S7DGK2_9BURK|nr:MULTISPECIES: MgtC/SapB family protein [Achromobacter]EFF73528.1 Mg2+ transporter-C family protein [Achromobacter piechaudii ATCC 43553]KNY09537.1 methyltransferase [Achromobacter piechaudii]MPS78387.1 MgtC/SapB family protein [Achromobacter sp.]CAB3732922.1 Protein SrpB [Achromobacter piechaudii]CAB3823820.1 Protein SrpB [Achromobacter piechaudii]
MAQVWLEIWTTVRSEFADIPDVAEATRIVLRLGMAVILGGLLGYERERSGKAAGLRTHMLVALGAAIFVLVPLQGGMQVGDISRVLQGVIAGIGFLGAGAIIKLSSEREIHGLTTSASIWMTAAIGVAAGMGREATALVSTLLALFVLAVLRRVEARISERKEKKGLIATDDKPARNG